MDQVWSGKGQAIWTSLEYNNGGREHPAQDECRKQTCEIACARSDSALLVNILS